MGICRSQSSIRFRVFYHVMCSVVGRHRYFGGICCCLLQGRPEIAFPKGFEFSPSSPPNGKSKGKGKSVPLQAWSGPEGSRKLRFPDFMKTAHDGGKVFSLTHRPPLLPGNALGRVQTERDGTRAETRFGLPAKWTSPFTSAGVSVQSSTGFLGVRVGRERL